MIPSGFASTSGMTSDVSTNILFINVSCLIDEPYLLVSEAYMAGEFESPDLKEVLNVSDINSVSERL